MHASCMKAPENTKRKKPHSNVFKAACWNFQASHPWEIKLHLQKIRPLMASVHTLRKVQKNAGKFAAFFHSAGLEHEYQIWAFYFKGGWMRNFKELLITYLNQTNHFVIHLPDFWLKQHEKKFLRYTSYGKKLKPKPLKHKRSCWGIQIYIFLNIEFLLHPLSKLIIS